MSPLRPIGPAPFRAKIGAAALAFLAAAVAGFFALHSASTKPAAPPVRWPGEGLWDAEELAVLIHPPAPLVNAFPLFIHTPAMGVALTSGTLTLTLRPEPIPPRRADDRFAFIQLGLRSRGTSVDDQIRWSAGDGPEWTAPLRDGPLQLTAWAPPGNVEISLRPSLAPSKDFNDPAAPPGVYLMWARVSLRSPPIAAAPVLIPGLRAVLESFVPVKASSN